MNYSGASQAEKSKAEKVLNFCRFFNIFLKNAKKYLLSLEILNKLFLA